LFSSGIWKGGVNVGWGGGGDGGLPRTTGAFGPASAESSGSAVAPGPGTGGIIVAGISVAGEATGAAAIPIAVVGGCPGDAVSRELVDSAVLAALGAVMENTQAAVNAAPALKAMLPQI